jgi:hypothetical protein
VRRHSDVNGAWIALLIVLVIGGMIWYHQHIESDCKAKGGYVKWLYGGKHQADNYLCLSPDGRILG